MAKERKTVAIETARARKSEGFVVSQKEDVDALIAAFDREVHFKNPNSERLGCPGTGVLTKLINEPTDLDATAILDHVRECAPCLDELKKLRLQAKQTSPRDMDGLSC